jgi:glutamate/tyrosine decarboxylase-like PLP-dependent enzyme
MSDRELLGDACTRHLDARSLRAHVEALLPVLERYWSDLERRPVRAQLAPGHVLAAVPSEIPVGPCTAEELARDLEAIVLPALTHWQHPRFLSYYPATTSAAAVASELAIAAMGSVGLQWASNPAATELEIAVIDWVLDLIHAPPDSPFRHRSGMGGGLLQNTAGDALVAVLVAARIRHHRRAAARCGESPDGEELFYRDSSRLVVYLSEHTHFSVRKAARVAGLRTHVLRPARRESGNYAIDAEQLRAAIAADRARGLEPCAVVLNVGTTNTAGIDDLASMVGLAEEEPGLWFHVDAAYAGAFWVLPEFREDARRVQTLATSFNFNGSKALHCGFDSAFLFVRERRDMKAAFSATDHYMAPSRDEDVASPELKDWAVPLGRRFRAWRIYSVLRSLGAAGIRALQREVLGDAEWLRAKVRASALLELVVESPFGLICVAMRAVGGEAQAEFLAEVERASGQGALFLAYPSEVEGRRFLRLATGGSNTRREDLARVFEALEASVLAVAARHSAR